MSIRSDCRTFNCSHHDSRGFDNPYLGNETPDHPYLISRAFNCMLLFNR